MTPNEIPLASALRLSSRRSHRLTTAHAIFHKFPRVSACPLALRSVPDSSHAFSNSVTHYHIYHSTSPACTSCLAKASTYVHSIQDFPHVFIRYSTHPRVSTNFFALHLISLRFDGLPIFPTSFQLFPGVFACFPSPLSDPSSFRNFPVVSARLCGYLSVSAISFHAFHTATLRKREFLQVSAWYSRASARFHERTSDVISLDAIQHVFRRPDAFPRTPTWPATFPRVVHDRPQV